MNFWNKDFKPEEIKQIVEKDKIPKHMGDYREKSESNTVDLTNEVNIVSKNWYRI